MLVSMRRLLRNSTGGYARIITVGGFVAAGGLAAFGCSSEEPATSSVSCGAGTELVNGVCEPAGSGGSGGNSGAAQDASAGGSAGTAAGGTAGTANGGSAGGGGIADASTDTPGDGSAGQGGATDPDASAGAGGGSGESGSAGAAGAAGDGGNEPPDGSAPDASYPVCPMATVDITDAIDVAGYYDSFTSGQGTLSGSCGGDGAGEAVLRYFAQAESVVSIQLTTQSGQSHLDSVLYVRTQCDDPDSELACNDTATYATAPTVVKVPAGPFYIFVDGYGGSVGKYRITMTKTPACHADSDCVSSPAGPVCNEATGLCVGCLTAFDCPANAPACESTDYFGQGPRACMDLENCQEDAIETGLGSDDGPAVARLLVPGPDGKASAQGLSCYVSPGFAPIMDSDWFKFQVGNATDATVRLDYPTLSYPGRLRVYDEQGRVMGESAKAASPDVISLKLLPAGTYYVQAYLKSNDMTFTVSLSVAPGQPCSNDQDCLSFDTAHAIMRPRCDPTTHACETIEGASLGTGQLCDSHDDCQSGRCSYVPFSSSPAIRAFCSTKCASDLDCPFGQVCSNSETLKMCKKPCAVSQECGPIPDVTPSGSAEWAYHTCNSSTGVCAAL